jgi:hypothetical protein
MRNNPYRALAVIPLIAAFSAVLVFGQWTTAKITGNVKDEEGKYLPGVQVTVTNIKSNAVTSAVTAKKKGTFRILALEPGFYQVSFDLEGYESHTVSGIQLSADQSLTLRITLKKEAPAAEPSNDQ